MRLTLFSALLLFALAGQAQTHFYINSIQVQPPQPTDQDLVNIALIGDLSSTGAYIVSSSASVTGSTVVLDVVAADPGGLTVLVPHGETVPVGQLPAGTYTVQVNGTAVGDFAPPAQHTFTVSGTGGSPCDSVEVVDVAYHPFDPGQLLLTSYNGSSELFPYPGFILYDANSDTLGIETVNFFGLAGTTTHELTVHPQAMLPSGPFSGTAELWVGFGDSLACSLPVNGTLCPDTACTPLLLTLTNTGGMQVMATFSWQLLDDQQNVVGSGVLELDNQSQADSAALCLPPGAYGWSISTAGSPGGQLYLSVVDPATWGVDTTVIFQPGLMNTLPFSVYADCPGIVNALPDLTADDLVQVVVRGDGMEVIATDGQAIGDFRILDLGGRLLMEGRLDQAQGTIRLSRLPSGILLLRTDRGSVRFLHQKH